MRSEIDLVRDDCLRGVVDSELGDDVSDRGVVGADLDSLDFLRNQVKVWRGEDRLGVVGMLVDGEVFDDELDESIGGECDR